MTLRLNLGGYLQRHNITAYRLVGEVQGRVAPNTVYTMARRPAQRIDLATVDELLSALERLTGEKVEIADVLDRLEVPSPSASPTPQPEARPLYDPNNRKTFRYSGYRVKLAPGPSAEDIVAELRGHAK